MNLDEFKKEFALLGDGFKTADLDRFNKQLIKRGEDVEFLAEHILTEKNYHRTFFQVSLAGCKGIEAKFAFIEKHFDKLQDWWHVDQLSQFVDKELTFAFGYEKAKEYIEHPHPFARRWGYVLFMPSLVKEKEAAEKLFPLFKDDDAYYVQMAEAWLLSYLGIYAPEETLAYLKTCPLEYNIAGKAIQKICDSYRVSPEWKEKFRQARTCYK